MTMVKNNARKAGVFREQRRETVKKCLDSLPAREKEALEYRYWVKEGRKVMTRKLPKDEAKALRRFRSRRILIGYY